MRGSASRVFLSLSVAAAIAACHIPSVAGMPTAPQMRKIIDGMLRRDRVYERLLSERIKLSAEEVPPSVKHLVSDANTVDPLFTLHDLMKIGGGAAGDTYSGDALALATAIVGASVRCLTLKRVVVQLLLTLRMAELETDKKPRTARALVLAYILPRLLDVQITSFGSRYTELLKVYDAIGAIESEQTDWTVREGHEERLAEQVQTLNDAVAGSCAVSAANEYYADMELKAADPSSHPTVITGEQKVATDIALPVVVDLLKENENAMLNLHEDMWMLKNMGPGAWKSVLKSPDLTPNAKDFTRKSRTSYYDDVASILEKSWMELPAAALSSENKIVEIV